MRNLFLEKVTALVVDRQVGKGLLQACNGHRLFFFPREFDLIVSHDVRRFSTNITIMLIIKVD